MNRQQASPLLPCMVLLSLGALACPHATTPVPADNPPTGGQAPDEATPDGAASSGPAAAEYTPEEIDFVITRQADGVQYFNFVEERYTLGADSFLDYSAYFGGMPIQMNHNDDVRWDAGEHGRALFDALRTILADPALFADLTTPPDGAPEPSREQGYYAIRVERNHGDVDYVLQDRSTRSFGILDAAFAALVSAFESDTGRPLSPGQLPQN